MKALGRCRDHCVALGIECDEGDRVPVSDLPRPAPRGFCPCALVERIASLEDRAIFTGMSLRRTDVADATMTVIVVVPTDERTRPAACLIEIGEALRGELRSVLRGAKHRFDEGVVVAGNARAGVRGLQAQPMRHRQHRGHLERRTVIPVQHRFVLQRVQALGKRRAA